ncbi:MAG: HAD family phosphatase [Clostridia bacterium]|nr:HAD family phosphatase [Clostridia bacterium]
MISLIAMDMDGTLLSDHTGRIAEENVRALREAGERGIRLALASGRFADDAGGFARLAGLDLAVIGLNGGHTVLHPGGETFDTRVIDPEEAAALFRLAQGSGLLHAIFATHTLWVSDPGMMYSSIWGTYLNQPWSRIGVCSGGAAAERLIREGVHKIVVITEDRPETLAVLRQRVIAELPGLTMSSSWFTNIEVNAGGVSKASALERLAAHYGILMAEVMTLGDGENDCAMLKAAGCGVAMGNAAPEAIACARWQTAANTEFGVAWAVRELALGQKGHHVRPVVHPESRGLTQ